MEGEDIRKKISKIYESDLFLVKEDLSEQEFFYALSIVRKDLDNALIPYADKKLFFYVIVRLTRDWDSLEEGWFTYLSKRIFSDDQYSPQKFYLMIISTMDEIAKWNVITLMDSFRKKYYATACCYALSPLKSMESFFDLCFHIFLSDFEEEYDGNKEDLKEIASYLKNRFNKEMSDEDDFSIGSEIYTLRIGIKALVFQKEELFLKLLDRIFSNIVFYYYERPYEVTNRLDQMEEEWWKKKVNSFGIQKRKEKADHLSVARTFQEIHPIYSLESLQVLLHLPSFRFQSVESPEIEMRDGEKVLLLRHLAVRKTDILKVTNPMGYPIVEPGDIQVQILLDGKIRYDSKRNLCRSFLLFTTAGKEVTDFIVKPGEYFLFTKDLSSMVLPKNISRTRTKHLYSVILEEGDSIQSGEREILVMDTTGNGKTDTCFVYHPISGLSFEKSGISYQVVRGNVAFFLSEDDKEQSIGVKIGDRIYPLSSLPYSIFEERKKYDLTSLLPNGKEMTVRLFSYQNQKKVLSLFLIRFEEMMVTYDLPLYYKAPPFEKGRVRIQLDSESLGKEFSLSEENYFLPYHSGILSFVPPILSWSLNGTDVVSMPKSLYYTDGLNNATVLTLNVPTGLSYQFLATDGNDYIQNGNSIRIGEEIYHLASLETRKDTTLFLRIDKTNYELLHIYLKPQFSQSPILVDSEGYHLYYESRYYQGPKDSKLFLGFEGEGVKSKLYPLTHSYPFDCSAFPEGNYHLRITLQENGFIVKEETLYENDFYLGNRKNQRFKNKRMKIQRFVSHHNKYEIAMKPFYLRNIRFLKTIDGFDIYEGSLFLHKYQEGFIILNQMRDPDGIYQAVNPIRIEILNNDSCLIGYGLDESDEELDYEGEFSVAKNKDLVIGDTSDRYYSVNYFKYQIEEEE